MRMLAKRMAVVGLLVCAFLAASVQPGYAYLYGDMYNEGLAGGSGWRGVGGDIYVCDWSLVLGDSGNPGKHVSSLYVHHEDYNPFLADGYNDPLDHNWLHMEVGVEKLYGSQPAIFWQWNRSRAGFGDWKKQLVYTIPASEVWVSDFKIGNVSMGSAAPETWHLNWGNQTMEEVRMPLVRGLALASAEREYLDHQWPPLGDSNKGRFKGLERKNSVAYWGTWLDATPIADGDSYYHFIKNSESDLSHGRY